MGELYTYMYNYTREHDTKSYSITGLTPFKPKRMTAFQAEIVRLVVDTRVNV